MTKPQLVIEWAMTLGLLESFGEQGVDPTTQAMAQRLTFRDSSYINENRFRLHLSRLVDEGLAIRAPRQHERVMRWQLTAVGKDTCDRLRDVFTILDSSNQNPEDPHR